MSDDDAGTAPTSPSGPTAPSAASAARLAPRAPAASVPPAPPAPPEDEPLDPASGLAIIAAQRAQVLDGVVPDSRVLFGLWGTAWFVGYLALWGTARTDPDEQPAAWAFVLFGVLISGGLAGTVSHIARRSAGVRGASARSGAMYGWSWVVGFSSLSLVMAGLTAAGASAQVLALAWNALPLLVVGTLYAAGAAMWHDWRMFGLGAWIALVAGVGTLLGIPEVYLLMALAGGGGMLVAAGLAHVARRSRGRA